MSKYKSSFHFNNTCTEINTCLQFQYFMSHLSALLAALGKPIDAMIFGDFGDKFLAAVVESGFRYQEVHVIFDRYEQNSIKAGTRERRTKTT